MSVCEKWYIGYKYTIWVIYKIQIMKKIYDKYISSYIDSMRNDICKIRTMNN